MAAPPYIGHKKEKCFIVKPKIGLKNMSRDREAKWCSRIESNASHNRRCGEPCPSLQKLDGKADAADVDEASL